MFEDDRVHPTSIQRLTPGGHPPKLWGNSLWRKFWNLSSKIVKVRESAYLYVLTFYAHNFGDLPPQHKHTHTHKAEHALYDIIITFELYCMHLTTLVGFSSPLAPLFAVVVFLVPLPVSCLTLYTAVVLYATTLACEELAKWYLSLGLTALGIATGAHLG